MKNEIIEITTQDVERRLISLRGQRVLIDRDVAEIQQLVENFDRFATMKHSISNYAFTERGLYMLATILKGPVAVQTTLSIIETFAQMREMARTMEQLQNVADGGEMQQSLLQKTGELLAEVVGRNLSTESTETEIELNFAVVKIKHKVIKKK